MSGRIDVNIHINEHDTVSVAVKHIKNIEYSTDFYALDFTAHIHPYTYDPALHENCSLYTDCEFGYYFQTLEEIQELAKKLCNACGLLAVKPDDVTIT